MTSSMTCLNDLSFLIVREKLVSLVREKNLDNVSMTSCTGDQKRRKTIVVFWIKTGSFQNQEASDDAAAMSTSDDERRNPWRIDLGVFADEDLSNLKTA
jgi:hypothetical protein